ncbi:4'-phosphopantetheinyl transferase [Micromonospora sp. WMMA1996]|uniref:4'-phosphopantetheinyl transferase family protein n=1 Tax=Micromonospora sp. WMMA1996 TaxID=2039878 RepID=UPI000BFA11B2|nr:4'-phosphopantetheinyl transferase superfamily protein [Micromonospora sp. WMMA1996]PGH45754.1 4'-phosphopantetheinyl transferase [Micromonospora sp. WMMA1996]
MIEALLPAGTVAVEAYADVPGEPPYPGEEDLVARAVDGRRREFVTARRCARDALAELGYAPAPIRPGPRREPIWPAGVVGSITHCAGYRAAAVAAGTSLAGLGIDAEPHEPLPDGVAGAVTAAGEPEHLGGLRAAHPTVHWDRLLFSAKESVYKAWYPLTGRWLGFEDAELTIDPAGRFVARVLVDGARADGGPPLRVLHGRWLVARGLVVTAVAVSAGSSLFARPDPG